MIYKFQGIPTSYLDTQGSRSTWIHRVQGIPGYTGFKVYLDTQVQDKPGYTGFKVYLDTQDSRYTWINRVQGIP